jgi:hypothetical protein
MVSKQLLDEQVELSEEQARALTAQIEALSVHSAL